MAQQPKNGVFLLLILMKLQRFSELQHSFSSRYSYGLGKGYLVVFFINSIVAD